jgi:dienelactone hydrolase
MSTFDRFVDGFYDVESQLPRYLRERAQACFAATDERKAAIDSVAAVERRCDRIRRDFHAAIGGLPDRRPPLDATTTGTTTTAEHTVETVTFQSLRSFHVTGTCYVPDERDGQIPGVLFLCGHATDGKAASDYQRCCRQLAASGCLVLAIDPIGQGERRQYEPERDPPRFGPTESHSYIGQQCTYAGANVARYMLWDAIRGLDYLEARPEVDPERLGVVGNSGGGTQTAYVALCDDRPAVAAPCSYITSRAAYMDTGQAHDAEQNVYGAIAGGIDYDDFLAAFAPKPIQIGAGQADFFPIEGTHTAYERAQAVYEQYDATEHVSLVVSEHTHGLDPTLRAATVEWCCRHLDAGPAASEAPPALAPERLQATDTGQVLTALSDERTVFDCHRTYVETHRPDADKPLAAEHEPYADALDERLRETFALDRADTPLYPRCIDTVTRAGCTWRKILAKSEPDIVVAGVLVTAEGSDGTPQLVLLPDGTESIPDHEQRLADLAAEHGAVVVFDPRGVGAVRSRPVNAPGNVNGGAFDEHYGTEFKLASDALMLGASLFGMRLFDCLRAVEYLDDHAPVTGPFGVLGKGIGALHAQYVGALADSVERLRLVDAPPSFYEQATTREFDIDYRRLVHDILGRCDLPQLRPALDELHVTRTETL